MAEKGESPEPNVGSADGSQVAESGSSLPVPQQPLDSFALARTLDGITSVSPRSLGGYASSSLVAGLYRQAVIDLEECRAERKQEQLQSRTVAEALGAEKIAHERTKAELSLEKLRGRFKSIAITIGVSMIFWALELGRNEALIALPVGLAGLVLVAFGWIPQFFRVGK